MALRAMYKGFKKVLAPLIIHRPGELAIDQDALNAELNTVFYPRSEQAVTGVVNLFDINAPRTNSAGVTSTVLSSATASSLNIKNAEAATYKETDYIGLSFPKNTDLKATFGVTVTSGKGRFYIDGSNDGTNWTSIASSDPITASGNFTVPFNTGNYSSYRIRWYCSFDVSAAGDITYTNIVIKSALDTSTTYVPFAMTNRELTDEVIALNLMSLDKNTLSSVDLDDITTTGVYKLSGSITHGAGGNNYGTLVVFKPFNTFIKQIQFATDSNDIYVRSYVTDTWTAWKKVAYES